MPRCQATKADGVPCERIVSASSIYCYAHDPERSEDRYRAASKAGRARPNHELRDVKCQLQTIADRAVSGELDTKRATAATQALQAKIRAIEVERRVRVEELEEALAELEIRTARGGRSAGQNK